MDAAVTGVAVAALVADGILAGAADLGNGIAFYASAGVSAAALTLAAFAVAVSQGAPRTVTGLLAAAALLSLAHSAMTARAAPVMFQIGKAGDEQRALAQLLQRFARWSAARAATQTATLIVIAIALS